MTIGEKAPDFTLPTDGGGTLSLSDLRGRKAVIYFYPKDNTPGCTVESQDFARLAGEFEKADCAIVGVSKDSVKSHDGFKAKHCLPFALLADTEGTMCEAYGVWREKKNYGKTYMGIARSTFLLNEEGIIVEQWSKVRVKGHAEKVLERTQNL